MNHYLSGQLALPLTRYAARKLLPARYGDRTLGRTAITGDPPLYLAGLALAVSLILAFLMARSVPAYSKVIQSGGKRSRTL
jgi:hypothetical protein